MPRKPIYVTQPSLAPLEEFVPYLEKVWNTGVMTHNGPLVQELEREMAALHGMADAVCLGNGTQALQLALRALGIKGEVITTPFTFAATAASIVSEGCTPVFVDIDPETWNLDLAAVERAITPSTGAIMPVHVFSSPCDVEAFAALADANNLKIVYDAAHAVCVKSAGRSIMEWGDISCTSFHATKLFNTGEGGACFTLDAEIAERIRRLRFFGFDGNKELSDEGTNAKMTEIAAALGIVNLRYLDAVRCRRRELYDHYLERLGGVPGVRFQRFRPDEYNYSYLPVLMPTQNAVDIVLTTLSDESIFPRRYFYPLLVDTPAFQDAQVAGNLGVARQVAKHVLCLPTYTDLADHDVDRICAVIQTLSRLGKLN